MSQHISRLWDNGYDGPCPCGRAPCGLVDSEKIHPACVMHRAYKTVRSSHVAEDCPIKDGRIREKAL